MSEKRAKQVSEGAVAFALKISKAADNMDPSTIVLGIAEYLSFFLLQVDKTPESFLSVFENMLKFEYENTKTNMEHLNELSKAGIPQRYTN